MKKTSEASPPGASEAAGWHWSMFADVCAIAGLNPAGARLIKFTNNAVFELADEPVVVRIPGSKTVQDRVEKVIAVARWLAEHDMPSVRLLNDMDQPVRVGDRKATLWQRVSGEGSTPTGRDLGRILRRYHSLPGPRFSLPPWRPMAAIRQRIMEAERLSSTDRTFLEQCCDETEEQLGALEFFLPSGPIHGDSFLGNLIPSPRGPVICDFDSAASGPREWDLTPVAVGKLRFNYTPDAHREIVESYGVDVLSWPGFVVMRKLRELQLVTSVLPVLKSNPSLTDQWCHRFATFRDGDTSATWSPYR